MPTIPLSLEPLMPTPDEPDTKALDAQLQLLVDAHKVTEARALLARTPGSERSPWAQVLALPVGKALPTRSGRGDVHVNHDWVRAHREEYAGQWVAMMNGELVDHDADFIVLNRRLDAGGYENLHLIPVCK